MKGFTKSVNVMKGFIFWSRWLQAPLYLGLIIAQGVYVYHFTVELVHLFDIDAGTAKCITVYGTDKKKVEATQSSVCKKKLADGTSTDKGGAQVAIEAEVKVMLSVLTLIDVVMIANLLVMVIIGGYETFVSRLQLERHPDQPEWLSQVNAGMLKVKLAMALIGISSIHLLKTFILAPYLNNDTIMWHVIIHLTFVVSAIAMAFTDKLMHPSSNAAK